MCKDKDHGGERCPSDTSDQHRLRRKANILKNDIGDSVPLPEGEIIALEHVLNVEEFKSQAETLRKAVHNAPTAPKAQMIYDAKLEKEITAFGMALGEEAERLANFDKTQLEDARDKLAEEIYNNHNKNMEANRNELSEIRDRWDEAGVNERLQLPEWTNPGNLSTEERSKLKRKEKLLLADYETKQNQQNELMEKYKELDKLYDEKSSQLYEESNTRLTQAYQKVIQSIRPVGGEIVFVADEQAEEAKQLLLSTVAKHYPTEWLNHHNSDNGEPIHLSLTQKRPNYDPSFLSETEDDGNEKTFEDGFAVNTEPEQVEKFERIFPHARTKTVSYKDWRGNDNTVVILKGNAEEIYDPEKHGSAEPTEATGWSFRPTYASLLLPESKDLAGDQLVDFVSQNHWVRAKTTTKKITPTLSLFDKKTANEVVETQFKDKFNLASAMAYHEFGHRMEQVLPNKILPRQERAFLMRRSNKPADEKGYNDMVETGYAGEYGHKGKFVSKYVGREYFEGNNYEVFTVGIESLYGGSNGGLVGNGVDSRFEDKDHRGFVLGMLATL